MNQPRDPDRLWSVVLAGGEGERVRALVQRWLGRHKPKQYCAFIGTRSMLQHTLDRAMQVTKPEHVVTVVAQGHQREAYAQLDGRTVGKLLLQPENRNTVAGIFLPLTYVRSHDPQATVVIYPSDHFVYPEDRFIETVRWMARAAECLPDRLVLLGTAPDSLELEYGWIQPGPEITPSIGLPVRLVRTFLEKPTLGQADVMMASGALWNTLVVAAKVGAFWKLGWHCCPEVMPLVERLGEAIGTVEEGAVLRAMYQEMPALNFSSDLLQRAPEHVAVLELSGVLWSDWGKPERITTTLRRIGRDPAFPLEYLEAPFAPIVTPRDHRGCLGTVWDGCAPDD